ncbi:DNA-3-methyladenine glycosylase [Antrihabitans sp. YC2-6]|uniref:DNA-3-methyladenine glycosylase n=1 Tax=Antrihabitans sp. YC2-6 TaxID=2799498 RepID=UPI0027DC5E57|nr:DNA-3-methyladenine glycosylase [Antrihabitans sp. YC2-6]
MTLGALLDVDPVTAASRILGATLTVDDVAVRIVEVEAYGGDPAGPWPDPAAHSYRGPTPRNRVMFGEAGTLYVYLSYGMHFCLNVTCGPPGIAGAVLLRSAEVVEGIDVVTQRRPAVRRFSDLARGPGNLGKVLAINLSDNGTRLFDAGSRTRLELDSVDRWQSGPRVGISTAPDRPWRLWLPESAAVSAYRRNPRAPAPIDAERSTS